MGMASTELDKSFSPRECQVITEVCKAKSIRDIACDFGISTNTVKEYLKDIYHKAGVHSARELMLKYCDPPLPRILGQRRDFSRDLLWSLEQLHQSGSMNGMVQALCAGAAKSACAEWSELLRVLQETPLTVALWSEGLRLRQMPSPILQSVLQNGFGLAQGTPWKSESKHWNELGCKTGLMAVRLRLGPHACILAVSKPMNPSFDHLGLATLGLLARTAEQHMQRLQQPATARRRRGTALET
jgi:DNA-binding CsgD family transcriptional regulator